MATYQYSEFVFQVGNEAFDKIGAPGVPAQWSGIYRCSGCGREEVVRAGKPLPSDIHHPHSADHGPVLWRLIVYADQKPKASAG